MLRRETVPGSNHRPPLPSAESARRYRSGDVEPVEATGSHARERQAGDGLARRYRAVLIRSVPRPTRLGAVPTIRNPDQGGWWRSGDGEAESIEQAHPPGSGCREDPPPPGSRWRKRPPGCHRSGSIGSSVSIRSLSWSISNFLGRDLTPSLPRRFRRESLGTGRRVAEPHLQVLDVGGGRRETGLPAAWRSGAEDAPSGFARPPG
jgi:hypothetical protein